MRRISDTRNPVKDKFGEGKNGFTGGNPQTGVPASTPGYEWFDTIQEELANLLEKNGIALDENNHSQLYDLVNGKFDDIDGYTKAEADHRFKKIGSLLIHFGDLPPAGALVCNGGEISRTTYADLFTAIGTKYGEGDGSTTFNLPNIPENMTILSAGANGSNVGQTTMGENKSHTHTGKADKDGAHDHTIGYHNVGYTGTSNSMWILNGNQAFKNTSWHEGHEHALTINPDGGAMNIAAGMKALFCITY